MVPEARMKIKLASVFVADQDRAIKICTDVLGFVKKKELLLENSGS